MTQYTVIDADSGSYVDIDDFGAGDNVNLQPQDAAANLAKAGNAAATVTLAAASGVSNVIGGVYFGYSNDPAGGVLTILDDTTKVLELAVTKGGPGFLPFDPPLKGTLEKDMVVSLTPGGAAISGYVNLLAWTV